jgi:hypothetical protein
LRKEDEFPVGIMSHETVLAAIPFGKDEAKEA